MSRKRKFVSGDIVRFRIDGELKLGTIASIKEYRDSDRREMWAEILCPPGKHMVSLDKVYEAPPTCRGHGQKLYSTERDEYICPFCNDAKK